MSLINPIERFLLNLEEDVSPEYIFLHVDKETAREGLKEMTGMDFGFDAAKWREWLKANGFLPAKEDARNQKPDS